MAITDRDILNALHNLNTATGAAQYAVTGWPFGCFFPCYGGRLVALRRVSDHSGAVQSFGGYGTKLELLLRIEAMIDGITVAKGGK